MVMPLGALRDEPDGPAHVRCGVLEKLSELLGGQMVRAGAGDKAAAGVEEAHGPQVDFLVTRGGLGQAGARFDEGGGVENDQVEGFASPVPLLELVEDVADAVGAAPGQAVPFGQGLCPLNGRRRLIEAGHAGRSVPGGMEAPQTRVAEAIQHLHPLPSRSISR